MSSGDKGGSDGVAAEQAAVVAFLAAASSWGDPATKVERIDTHGAHVFMAGDLVLKIKRSVRYSYMDFSTLERRRAALERELQINRAAAPAIYLSVVAITRAADGGLKIDGAGEPVEYALKMRRFDQSQLLSNVVRAGGVPPETAKAMADTVVAAHRRAEISIRSNGAAGLAGTIRQFAEPLCEAEPLRQRAERLRERASEALERCRAQLDERARGGFVRRCHGDLHLANIVLWQGRPTLFDAIEFDEELATIDTLYDLAFLLMDLDRHDARATANIVLNRYLWRSGETLDLAGLAALPLFLALRAGIRAMVGLQQARLSNGATAGIPTGRCEGYLDAALDYLAPKPARLVAVGGFSGTGKSTLAAALAPLIGPSPGAVHLRSDLERKALAGAEETERLPSSAYTAETAAQVYAVLSDKSRIVLSAGHAVVVDAVFSTAAERDAIEAVAAAAGLPFTGLWLEADAAKLAQRVSARTGDASDATDDVVRTQIERGAGTVKWTRIDAGGSPDDTVARARADLQL